MSIYFNNTTPSNIYYNGAEATLYYNGEQIWPENINYNPLNLPDKTFRIKLVENTRPTVGEYKTAVQISTNPNIWDVYVGHGPPFIMESAKLLEVIGANASGCDNMNESFADCTALTSVALFDTSNVSAINRMFKGCSALTSVPLYPISNTVTSTQNMFSGCSSLASVPAFDLSHVSECSRMFANCCSLTSVPQFDLSNAINLGSTFRNCINLTTVPQFNLSNTTSLNGTFQSCSSLSSIPLFNLPKVTDVRYAFRYCYNVNNGALALYNSLSTQANPPTAYTQTFRNCGRDTVNGAAELAQIPSDWK